MKKYTIGEKVRDNDRISIDRDYETIEVTRHDDPTTWRTSYTINDETPSRREGWEKIRRSCIDSDGLEPLLIQDGQTDTFSVIASDCIYLKIDKIRRYIVNRNWVVLEVLSHDYQ